MGLAPITHILTAPAPADSGTLLITMPDDAYNLPNPPFHAMVWPNNAVPIFGVNAEKVLVTARDGDRLTIQRSDEPIAIYAGLQIAALGEDPYYTLGELVTLTDVFDPGTGPYLVAVRSPIGEVGGFGSATGVSESGGTVTLELQPDRPGTWVYRWESADTIKPEARFVVGFSDVLE